MLKPLLYTVSTLALIGGLVMGSPVMAGNAINQTAASGVTSVRDNDSAEPKARFDVERDCEEVDPVRNNAAMDAPEGNEPQGRFDAARNCVTMERGEPLPGVTRDYDPGEGEKVYR